MGYAGVGPAGVGSIDIGFPLPPRLLKHQHHPPPELCDVCDLQLLLDRRRLFPALERRTVQRTTCVLRRTGLSCFLSVRPLIKPTHININQNQQALEQFSTDAADTENDPAKESIFDEKVGAGVSACATAARHSSVAVLLGVVVVCCWNVDDSVG